MNEIASIRQELRDFRAALPTVQLVPSGICSREDALRINTVLRDALLVKDNVVGHDPVNTQTERSCSKHFDISTPRSCPIGKGDSQLHFDDERCEDGVMFQVAPPTEAFTAPMETQGACEFMFGACGEASSLQSNVCSFPKVPSFPDLSKASRLLSASLATSSFNDRVRCLSDFWALMETYASEPIQRVWCVFDAICDEDRVLPDVLSEGGSADPLPPAPTGGIWSKNHLVIDDLAPAYPVNIVDLMAPTLCEQFQLACNDLDDDERALFGDVPESPLHVVDAIADLRAWCAFDANSDKQSRFVTDSDEERMLFNHTDPVIDNDVVENSRDDSPLGVSADVFAVARPAGGLGIGIYSEHGMIFVNQMRADSIFSSFLKPGNFISQVNGISNNFDSMHDELINASFLTIRRELGKKQLLCKFRGGVCPRGRDCWFSHSVEQDLGDPPSFKFNSCTRTSRMPNGTVK